jgi:hypothetical protein
VAFGDIVGRANLFVVRSGTVEPASAQRFQR